MENKKYTFWRFINEQKIEIPIIQRDYAQGRVGKEKLRKRFLSDLKKALDDKNEMKLDFVYATTENDSLNPLDGQQRLTTLWLLHWYIALKAGKLGEGVKAKTETEDEFKVCDVLKRFSYETRVSSREFIVRLCEYNNNPEIGNMGEGIQNQTWFYSKWKQDPTIQSMFRMLSKAPESDKKRDHTIDSMEELFAGTDADTFKQYWNTLTEDDCPIVFYYLDLLGLKQSDDLYIKMNARGEALTSFENFKADLVGYIKTQSINGQSEEEKADWTRLLDVKNGIPIKMDTTWTDIFWENKSSDYKIDEIYFAFINRFFFNELFSAKKEATYVLDIGKGDEGSTQENENKTYKYLNDSDHPNDHDTKIVYSGLDVYKYDNGNIPFALFNRLQNVLNGYSKYITSDSISQIPECSWNNQFKFIPEYAKDKNDKEIELFDNASKKIWKVTTLNQVERVVFFAVCKYFNDGDADKRSLNDWMRVVWNLVSGEDANGRPQIRSTSAMRTALEFIDKLNSHLIYKSITDKDLHINKNNPSDFESQCNEEREKAKKILESRDANISDDDERSWHKKITKAESYVFFKGAIRFLFTNENGEVDWTQFETKFENAKCYFGTEGVTNEYKKTAKLLRRLLTHMDSWGQWLQLKYDFEKDNWHDILLNSKLICPVHKLLIQGDATVFDFSSYNSNFDNEKQKFLTEFLIREQVLAELPSGWRLVWRQSWDGGRGVYDLDPQTRGSHPYFIIHPRVKLLIDNEITCVPLKVKNGYIPGVNIMFEYHGSRFMWYIERNSQECDVYLWDQKTNDYAKRFSPQGDSEQDKYYCFNVDTDFKKQLSGLIEQSKNDPVCNR